MVVLVIFADGRHYDISTSTDCNDPGQVPMMNGTRMRDNNIFQFMQSRVGSMVMGIIVGE